MHARLLDGMHAWCAKVQTCGTLVSPDGWSNCAGESVYGKSLAELAEKLLGPTGSSVECTFKKEVSKEMITVTLVRGINAGTRNR